MIKRIIKKIIILSLLFSLPLIGGTNSLFLDEEFSTGNTFSAGSVDFSLRDPADDSLSVSPLFNISNLKPNTLETKTVRVKKEGNLDFKYKVEAIKTGGDDNFCNALQIEAKLSGVSKYSGNLMGLTVLQETINVSGQDDWEFIAGFNNIDPLLQNNSCQFNLVFSGWQTDSDGSWGFKDQEILGNSISSGHWVPPVISNINILIATPNENDEKTATVTWNTDELSSSNLDWRIDAGSWNSLTLDTTADNTSHLREITGLLANTTYYYQVRSTDSFGNETISPEQMFETGNERIGLPPWSDIVINEYLPNPIGVDNALMPGGEWVELYNKGSVIRDLTGWYLTDANNSHQLYLTLTNTVSSDPATTGLNIGPGEFLVVYRNGNPLFDLNNSSTGDTVKLFGLEKIHVGPFTWTITMLEDFHLYTGILGDEVLENKSFARFPDGTNNWFDPIPSPGGPNILEPVIELNLAESKQTISFKVLNIDRFIHISYELTYETDNEPQGIIGEQELDNLPEFVKDNLTLGTCSTGGTCVYHLGVKNIKLKIILTDKEGQEIELEKSI